MHSVPPTLIPNAATRGTGVDMEVGPRARDSAPARYPPRRPSQSVLYRCVQQHIEPAPSVRAAVSLPVDGNSKSAALAARPFGAGTGYFAHSLETPFILSVMPHGVMVGLYTQF